MGTRGPSPQTAGSFAAAPDRFSKRASRRNGRASLPRMRASTAVQPFSAPGILQPDLRRKPAEGRSPPLIVAHATNPTRPVQTRPSSSDPYRSEARNGVQWPAGPCICRVCTDLWIVAPQPVPDGASAVCHSGRTGLADALEGLPRGAPMARSPSFSPTTIFAGRVLPRTPTPSRTTVRRLAVTAGERS